MKKIFTFMIAVFAIGLAKAGTFGMGDYVWKDDGTQTVLKTNDAYVKNDRKPVDLEMALGMWTFFENQGSGVIVLQYARGNANGQSFVAGAAGTTQAQSPNFQLNWQDVNKDSVNKDWMLAGDASSLTNGDYTPSGLTDYSGVSAFVGTNVAKTPNIIDFGGKVLVSSTTDGSITLDGTTSPDFSAGNYNYMKGGIKFAIKPGASVLPDSVYSFRLYCKSSNWDGETRGTQIGERTINFNTFEGNNNRIKTNSPTAADGVPDPNAVNGGNHFDHGMPFIMTGPDIQNPAPLAVNWSAPGLQASVSNGSVILTWGTETESNNKEFIVQRSVAGSNSFVNVGTVASKSNGGNSTSALDYKYTDGAPIANAVYRVAEVSNSGETHYSNSVSVALNDASSKLSVFPNPVVSGTLNVKGASAGSVYRIVSVNGINALSGKLNAAKQISVDHLATGVYVLQVATANGNTSSVMFVKK
jgi:hypothetical protein